MGSGHADWQLGYFLAKPQVFSFCQCSSVLATLATLANRDYDLISPLSNSPGNAFSSFGSFSSSSLATAFGTKLLWSHSLLLVEDLVQGDEGVTRRMKHVCKCLQQSAILKRHQNSRDAMDAMLTCAGTCDRADVYAKVMSTLERCSNWQREQQLFQESGSSDVVA